MTSRFCVKTLIKIIKASSCELRPYILDFRAIITHYIKRERMHTFQIAEAVLTNYKNEKLSEERINFLKAQAEEQLQEISQNSSVYEGFLNQVNPPKEVERTILWMLLMSNENICDTYIDLFEKGFREIIPVSDLADLLAYYVYLNKVEKRDIDGFEFLLNYEHEGLSEVDQFAFTNVLLYVEKSKQVAIEF